MPGLIREVRNFAYNEDSHRLTAERGIEGRGWRSFDYLTGIEVVTLARQLACFGYAISGVAIDGAYGY